MLGPSAFSLRAFTLSQGENVVTNKENIAVFENDHCQSRSNCELLEFIILF